MKRCRGACHQMLPNEDFPYRGAVGTKYRDVICCRCLGAEPRMPELRRAAAADRMKRLEFVEAMLLRHARRTG